MGSQQQGPWGRRPSSSGKNTSTGAGETAGADNSHNDDDRVYQYDQNDNPWGRAGGRRHNGGRGPNATPPDFEDLLAKLQEKMKNFGGGGGYARLVPLVALVLIGLWASSGLYRVEAGQRGVELVFGRFHEITDPGLRYNFPSPIGEVYLPQVDQQRRMNIGFRSDEVRTTGGDLPKESLMLTSDENIVDLDFTVFWKIQDPEKFLFIIRDPEATVKVVAESAMREVVGQTSFDQAVTRGREEIERLSLEVMQRVLDSYDSGILIEQVELQASDPPPEVIDAFNDVQRARQDRDRMRNQAEAYSNSVVPQARGQSERILREAEAYRERLIQEAIGEAQRFNEVYDTYVQSPEVTRQRMYLEVLGEIYTGANKVIIDPNISGGDGSGVVPYLPLNELTKPAKPKEENQ